ISTWTRLKARKRRLALCGLQSNCAKLVDVLRLGELFELYPTRAAAQRRIAHAGAVVSDEPPVRIRVTKNDVPWDSGLVQHNFIAGDNEPICSVVLPREQDDIWSEVDA